MKFVLTFRTVIYCTAIIVFLLGFISKAHAFWPPDLIPHPEVPEPKNINDGPLVDRGSHDTYGPREN